jgi:hypothetical protein
MRALTAIEIVRTWQWGQDKHPVDRALMVLSLVQPELTAEQVAALSVGQRNARLLAVRERTLGGLLDGFAHCPQCGEPLEFGVETEAIRRPEPSRHTFDLVSGDYTLHCRLPNSNDLAALVMAEDAAIARRRLIERCVHSAVYGGVSIPVESLPETLLSELAGAVREHDPQADMRFLLDCAACGHEWSASFDIVSFFWAELGDRAKRLMIDVHTLARAYGWRETEILTMSASSRQFYLDLNLDQSVE